MKKLNVKVDSNSSFTFVATTIVMEGKLINFVFSILFVSEDEAVDEFSCDDHLNV